MAISGKNFFAIQVERVDGHGVDFDDFRSEINTVFVVYVYKIICGTLTAEIFRRDVLRKSSNRWRPGNRIADVDADIW
jgi:hypothetical protein